MRSKTVRWTWAIGSMLLVVALGPSLASADIQAFMKIPGVAGESTNEQHKGEIDLLSYSQSVTPSVGDGACFKVTVVKNLDRTSPVFAAFVALEKVLMVTITLAQTGANPRDIFTAVLENTIITSVELVEVDGTPLPTERLTLQPTRARISFVPQKPDGSSDGAVQKVINCL